ncbi:hypothetical protein J7T55_004649 [Diaporthe amygdali]|uniref:uncharacterized protein n=1 Tax=Phomopsis amygdali TaxID=1214568 RepID=UPI0022FEA09D|nr:uncharacterized protein J7T55_004649 [Diaporthe amygdali]KAJ0114907.1 hypothetical protein J7T55_004649 [Diaporthe amygdali]
MPFPFIAVADLLQSLENDLGRRRHRKGDRAIVEDWFARYRQELDDDGTDKCALLSTLLPERRTDRVYSIKEKTLQPKLARAFGLGYSRVKELSRWTVSGSGLDLAECAEAILQQTPNPRTPPVTVEEIDTILHALAANNLFSAPSVRSSGAPSVGSSLAKQDGPLEALFRRLSAREAKWVTRLILKSFLPVVVPEWLVYACCHHLLPTTMKIHDNFVVATRLLEQQCGRVTYGEMEPEDLPRLLKPQIGVKVGRQTWLKGRSIKHCLEMGRGLMSVENKLDGEYCQIHIDLSKGSNCRIQIFSKSGKDSTQDRKRLHKTIEASLELGTPSCKIKSYCILEGEMAVWSDKEQRILSFDKIRKHVSRSGRFIGTDEDSQAHEWEHLMIVYYDLLRVDDESLLNIRHSERFSRLSRLVQCQTGRAALVQRQIINFTSRIAAEELREAFASCIVKREEGLVLKPDEPYFSFGRSRRRYASCCVKLKKGFIKKMGDVGDFAVIAGRYCATRAKVLKMPNVKYTHFYLGCLTNKEAVERWDARPEFTVVNEVEMNATMLDHFRRTWFTDTVPLTDDRAPVLNVPPGIVQGSKIITVFTEPAVFDMTCFSFHKESNTPFWSLRFPYVSKIHTDRTWMDCITFQELQVLAEDDIKCPDKEDSQELAQWIEALEQAEPKTRRATVHESQSTEATASTSASQCRTPQRSIEDSPVRPHPANTIAAVKAGLPTPPISSALQPSEDSTSAQAQPSRKRRREPLSTPSRRTKSRNNEPEVIDLTSPTLSNSQRSQRQPLEDITSAPSSQGNVFMPNVPCMPADATDNWILDDTKLGEPAEKVSTTSGSSPLLPLSPAAFTCGYAGGVCALAGFFVLLSPCIASMPLLTEDVLPAHGVNAVFTDIPSWLASNAPQTGPMRRPRRLVLVERQRRESTNAFIRKLESSPLRRRNGDVEIVLAYDWRLLEAITEEEKKNQRSDGSGTRQTARTGANREELWRRYYFGCIDERRD